MLFKFFKYCLKIIGQFMPANVSNEIINSQQIEHSLFQVITISGRARSPKLKAIMTPAPVVILQAYHRGTSVTLFIWHLAVKAATSQLFCLLAHGYIGIMSQTYIYLILNNIKFVINRNSVNILCYFTFPYYHQYCATCHYCLSQFKIAILH